jgi:hypothetical protein
MSKGEVVWAAYGVPISPQGQGFHPALELLALAAGVIAVDQSKGPLPKPDGGPIRILRPALALARILASSSDDPLLQNFRTRLIGETCEETLHAILKGLLVPMPNRRKVPLWWSSHFYPYAGELVHYDVAVRRGKLNSERVYYRGTGGLAFRLLRSDPEPGRHAAVSAAIADLVRPGGAGALGSVISALSKMDDLLPWTDSGRPDQPFSEQTEMRIGEPDNIESYECLNWTRHLRDGVHKIGTRKLTRSRRMDALIRWVPFCIAMMLLERCDKQNGGNGTSILPIDLLDRPTSLRQASHKCLQTAIATIRSSADRSGSNSGVVGHRREGDDAQKWFTGTLGMIGALNAMTGRRYFTFNLELLEAIVLATIDGQEEPIDIFCARLHKQLGLVVDAEAAENSHGLLERADHRFFDECREVLCTRLLQLGMLVSYSDSTQMVRIETQ